MPPSASTPVRRLQRRYHLVLALGWFATVLPMPIQVLLAQSRGFTLGDVGLYMGLHALAVALLEVPTGGVADVIGRKRVALLAHACAALALACFLFAHSLPLLLVAATVQGAARALGSGTLQAWFVDALRDAEPGIDLQRPLALAGTFELLALAAGTLAGGFMPTALTAWTDSGNGFVAPLATPVLAAIVMQGAALLAVARLVHEVPAGPSPRPGRAPGPGIARLAHVLGSAFHAVRCNATLRLLLGVAACNGFVLAGLEAYWQPFFADRTGAAPGDAWMFGALLAGCFGVGMLGNLAAIPVGRWSGRRYARLAAAFQALRVAALVLIAHQRDLTTAVALFWGTYFLLGATHSPLATLLNDRVPAQRRSVMLSVESLASYAGAFAGSLLLGWLAERASIGTAWTAAGLVLTVSVALLLRVDDRQPEPVAVRAGR